MHHVLTVTASISGGCPTGLPLQVGRPDNTFDICTPKPHRLWDVWDNRDSSRRTLKRSLVLTAISFDKERTRIDLPYNRSACVLHRVDRLVLIMSCHEPCSFVLAMSLTWMSSHQFFQRKDLPSWCAIQYRYGRLAMQRTH